MILNPTPDETAERDRILDQIRESVRSNRKVPMARPGGPDPFCGSVGPYAYRFEGEADLLHLMVWRPDERPFPEAEARALAAWVLQGVPPGVVFYRPGEQTQSFFLAHDELLP